MTVPHTPASFAADAFNCPTCGAYASQTWTALFRQSPQGLEQIASTTLGLAVCRRCQQFTVWVDQHQVHPHVSVAPRPNPDLSDDIRIDYEEAAGIVGRSPRGAAALLRLCIQKLCKELGKKGRNIDEDIASLVRDGLPVLVRQALDVVRVIGNEAVHPGELDLRDDPETALQLFELVNFIADNRISEPKRIQEIFNQLPEGKRKAIEARDKGALPPTPGST